jgi:DNA-binding CsgD family transcriptional regulator
VRTAGIDRLTGQEREILRRIADGLSSKEIADQLAISRKTVDAHRANICNKLEIHGQYGLTRFAVRHRADL